MRRRRVFSFSVAALAGGVIGLAVVSWRQGLPLLPGPARRQAVAEAKLRQVLPSVEFRAIPFDKAVDQLRSLSGANLVVDWDDLEKVGLGRDLQIDLQVRHVTLEQTLKSLVGYANSGRDVGLDYTVYDGKVVITTGYAIGTGRYAYAAVYDVRDIDPAPPESSWNGYGCFGSAQAPPPASNFAQSKGLFGNMPNPPAAPLGPPTRAERDKDLVDFVRETVQPEIWHGQGGSGGSVRAFAGRLLVVTTWQNHRQIGDLLSQLRSASAKE
jgi:hypothetical protein